MPFEDRGSTDHLPSELIPSPGSDRDVSEYRFYRIEVSGRPMGIRIGEDNRTFFVANNFKSFVRLSGMTHVRANFTILEAMASLNAITGLSRAIVFDRSTR